MKDLSRTATLNATAGAGRLLRRVLECLPPGPGSWLERSVAVVRSLGPYAAIELLLPGGTLIVVLLWLYRRYYAARLAAATTEYA